MAFHTEDGVGDAIILDSVSSVDVCITWELVVPAGRSGTGMIWLAEESAKCTEGLVIYSEFPQPLSTDYSNTRSTRLIDHNTTFAPTSKGVELSTPKTQIGLLTSTDFYLIASSSRGQDHRRE